MNYIKHLTAFFEKIATDEHITPFHISLYMALFQLWNAQRFENPISIARAELMQLSKIGSTHTYYKCLNELHLLAYIIYVPSKSNLTASKISLCIFDTSNAQAVHQVSSKSDTSRAQAVHQGSSKSDTSHAQAVHPYNKHNINIINNKTYREQNSKIDNQILNSEKMKTKKSKRKKAGPGAEKNMLRPTLNKVITFFMSEGSPEIEAKKFFNHFESNGWKVGGKSPMKNWQAAGRNWILNSKNFIPPKDFPKHFPIPKTPKPSPNNKNYAEPL